MVKKKSAGAVAARIAKAQLYLLMRLFLCSVANTPVLPLPTIALTLKAFVHPSTEMYFLDQTETDAGPQ